MFQWVGPLVFSKTYFYRTTDRTDIDVKTLNDVTRFSVGIPRNDIYESVLLKRGFVKGENLLDLSYRHEMIDLFFNGKLDLIIASELTLPYQLKSIGRSLSAVERVIELPIPELKGNFLALNLNVPDDITQRFNQSLQRLREGGELDEIIKAFSQENFTIKINTDPF